MKLSVFTDMRRANKNGQYSVNIRVNIHGHRFYFHTGIYCTYPPVGCEFQRTEKSASAKTKNLIRIMSQCQEWAMGHPHATPDEAKTAMTEIATGRKIASTAKTLTDYFLIYIEGRCKKVGTAKIYRTTYNKLLAYSPNATFDTIDRKWLEQFERHLRASGCSTNYIGIQFRNIRAVFNYAIDDGITTNYPFRKFKIRQEQTEKRNLTTEQLRKLRDTPLDGFMAEYRDMFLLMVYLIGINAADLFTLTPDDYHDGRIHYRRSKTGSIFSIKVEPEAATIINRYRGTSHLLCPLDRYADHRDYLHHMNAGLKHIGKIYNNGIGWSGEAICKKLSSYWSRHTWATIAASLDIPLDVISLALGHSFGNKVTQIYIEWSKTKVDDANRKVIDSINGNA